MSGRTKLNEWTRVKVVTADNLQKALLNVLAVFRKRTLSAPSIRKVSNSSLPTIFLQLDLSCMHANSVCTKRQRRSATCKLCNDDPASASAARGRRLKRKSGCAARLKKVVGKIRDGLNWHLEWAHRVTTGLAGDRPRDFPFIQTFFSLTYAAVHLCLAVCRRGRVRQE